VSFAHPPLVWVALAAIPVLAAVFTWSWRVRRRLISRFVPKRLQESLTIGISPNRATFRASLIVFGIVSLLLALARPRLGAGSIEVNQRGLDILVAIDTSRSMLAEDAGPQISRLQRAKLAALDLARLAKTDRLGLVAFAGSAFLQCPLTIDFEAFRQSIDALDTSVIQQGGTSIGPAINAAIEAVSEERANVRVLVLFTDGEEHETGAIDAAKRAESKGLKIFTIGVGTPEGEVIRLRDANGALSYLKDSRGNAVKSSLNESLLRELATLTGGLYLPLQGPRAMTELYTRALEPLPKADLDSRLIDQYLERFQFPLALALLLLLAEALFPECARVGNRLRASRTSHPTLMPPSANASPTSASATTSTANLVAALALLGFLSLCVPAAEASPNSALRHYRKADYPAAQAEFERLAQEKPTDPRLKFNAGAAAFRAGNLKSASQHFQDALASTDLKLQSDTFYNLGNTLFHLGEQAGEPNERQKSWENSLRSFEAAVKLAPQHTNAQHNLDYVRQRLDELKQQQQQQKQQQKSQGDNQDKDKSDEKDSSQSQDQEKKDSKEQDQKESQPEDGQESDQKPQPNTDAESPQDDPESENQSPEQPSDQKTESPQDNTPESQKPGSEQQADNPSAQASDEAPAGEMSPQQALRLLDSAKGEEKLMPLEKKRARARTLKDW